MRFAAFRGVSQSDEDVAVQASLDWSHASGVYTGFWSSNVDLRYLGNEE